MKTILMTLALIFTGIAAQAQVERQIGGDQMYEIIKCQAAVARPDLGMSLSVTQGGIAAITEINVQHFFLGHSTSQKFVVKQLATQPNTMGAPMIFVGKGVRLNVNFTVAPGQDGRYNGTLSTLQSNGKYADEALSCNSVAHIMTGADQAQM